MEEVAAVGVKEAALAASSGNLGALLVFVLCLFTLAAVILGGALIRERGKRKGDKESDLLCIQPGGCPDIAKVSAQVSSLIREFERDGADRREHRSEIRQSVADIHRRIDDTPTRTELEHVVSVSQAAYEEMNRGLMALTDLAASIRSAPDRRRAPPKKIS